MVKDVFSFFGNNAGKILLVIFAIFVLLCFGVTLNERSKETTSVLPNEIPCYLVADSVVKVSIDSIPEYPVYAISVLFGTYARNNEGIMTVRLYEDDKILQEWRMKTENFGDNVCQDFLLNEPYTLKTKSKYYLSIVDTYKGENALALWQSKDGNGCYTVKYKEPYPLVMLGIFSVFVIIIVGMLLYGVRELYIMYFMLAIAAFMFWCNVPLNGVPDEQTHFLRSYEIANYSLISDHVGPARSGGHVMCWGLNYFSDESVRINKDLTEEYIFPGAALYSPISYLPQAIGIKVTGWMSARVYKLFNGGRVANALLSLALCILALQLIPFGRKILFVIMLLPITMQEMVSLAPDSLVNSLSMLWIAYILNIAYTDRKVTNKTMAFLMLIGFTLAMLKIIYIVLLLMIFILPKDKFVRKKNFYIFGGVVIVTSLLANVIWLMISSQYLVEFNPGVEPSSQIKSIIETPINYIAVLLNTSMSNAEFFIKSGTGTCLGWLDILTSPYIWIMLLMTLTYETLCCYDKIDNIKNKHILLMLSCCIICSLLIYTSLYVQWTPLKYNIVNGIQGRYFIPLLAYFAISCVMIHRKRYNIHAISPQTRCSASYLYLIIGLALADALTIIVE